MYDTVVVSETDIIGGKPIQVRPAVFQDRESAYDYIRGKADYAETSGILEGREDFLAEADVFTMTMKSGNTFHYRVDVI